MYTEQARSAEGIVDGRCTYPLRIQWDVFAIVMQDFVPLTSPAVCCIPYHSYLLSIETLWLTFKAIRVEQHLLLAFVSKIILGFGPR
jgi:hypothetical protein